MKFDNALVTILVRGDYGACYDFYKEKLGLVPTWGDRNGPWTGFAVREGGEYCLAIFSAEKQAAYKGYVPPVASVLSDNMSIGIPSDNVDGDYERLKEAGVEFIGEPQTIAEWGMRCVYFRDSEGNLLSLTGDMG
jgi:predicted enzyme related to lactoylglutathione lyase